jgi:microcystin-dependent protein
MDGNIAEIRGFAGNFAPRNWSYCNGALLSISSNTALYSLIGNTYGGDGRTTMGLPNLQGRVPMGAGTGPGLTPRTLGQSGGVEREKLSISEMPPHNHPATTTGMSVNTSGLTANLASGKMAVNNGVADHQIPAANDSLAGPSAPSGRSTTPINGYNSSAPNTGLNSGTLSGTLPITGTASVSGVVTIGLTGGGNAHQNMQPYQVINWIICMFGVYPSRS